MCCLVRAKTSLIAADGLESSFTGWESAVWRRISTGALSSDGGGLLLRQVESRHGVISGFARCFRDGRNPLWAEFTLEQMVAQRVYGLALGYEDLNDHDDLRRDPLMGVLAEREDPLGQDRHFERDRGKPCAGKSTLNRLELSAAGAAG